MITPRIYDDVFITRIVYCIVGEPELQCALEAALSIIPMVEISVKLDCRPCKRHEHGGGMRINLLMWRLLSYQMKQR